MKIFAQQGYGPKDKLTTALSNSEIEGVILSPRYLKPQKLSDQIEQIAAHNGQAYMDPEWHAAIHLSHPMSNLGNLETWSYFTMPRRGQLISGAAIPKVLENSLQVQKELGLQEWIAPNVLIDNADSIETGISLNFISRTKEASKRVGNAQVFATLALSRDAILNTKGFQDIFDALTSIPTPPDGVYIVVGSTSSSELRSDLYHPQVIAGWMYMNYALSINGIRVMNGYCHLLTPLLGIAGAESCASGWHSGLRQFVLGRYVKTSSGGRQPAIHYISNALLSRIRQTDYLAFKRVVPEVANSLPNDVFYNSSEPDRTLEARQSWEALSALTQAYCSNDIERNIPDMDNHLTQAIQFWTKLANFGLNNGAEANLERLRAMKEGLALFTKWAEISVDG